MVRARICGWCLEHIEDGKELPYLDLFFHKGNCFGGAHSLGIVPTKHSHRYPSSSEIVRALSDRHDLRRENFATDESLYLRDDSVYLVPSDYVALEHSGVYVEPKDRSGRAEKIIG